MGGGEGEAGDGKGGGVIGARHSRYQIILNFDIGGAKQAGALAPRPILEMLVTLPSGGAASWAASAACPLWIE